MSVQHEQPIWIPVNYKAEALSSSGMSYDAAHQELTEYQFQTNNSGAVFHHQSDEIVWPTPLTQ